MMVGILQPWLVGWYCGALVGILVCILVGILQPWLVGWYCGALEQLGLSCGGRLAAHIVGARPRPWGGQGGFGRGEGPRG